MKKISTLLLLLSLCLNMWGCSNNSPNANSMQTPSTHNSSTSNQQSSNSNNGSTAPSAKIDPNGFSSLEELIDAIIAFQYAGTATQTQVQKLFPEKYFEKNYGSFEAAYSKYLSDSKNKRARHETSLGSNWSYSYMVIASDLRVDMSKVNFSTNEDAEHLELYGVSLKNRCQYTVTVSITFKGSKNESISQVEVNCAKVGNKWYGW